MRERELLSQREEADFSFGEEDEEELLGRGRTTSTKRNRKRTRNTRSTRRPPPTSIPRSLKTRARTRCRH